MLIFPNQYIQAHYYKLFKTCSKIIIHQSSINPLRKKDKINMGLQGRLEDLALSDIVQIIYLSKKSGVLNIKDAKSDGNIFFKNGLIIAAESSNITTKLVDMLLETNKINSEEYRLAVEIHKKEVSK